MTEANSHPPMAWCYCGDQVKLWRESTGVSREELCKKANYQYEYVKSMENGRRKPTLRLLRAADELCGANGKLLAAHRYLKPEPFPARSQEFMLLEAAAIALDWYEPLLIPGLLQTEEYARALISGSFPPLDEETVEERVNARLQRAEALRKRPTTIFNFVMYEAALRTVVGDRGLMKRQFDHVLAAGELRNVSVQVLPMSRCPGAALNGSLVLLETPDHEHVGYVEGQETSALYADPAKVSLLAQTHGMIRLHALSVEESAEFIGNMAEEL
ncbi:helix-turn-helix transcriptional regulator [Streptomyces sp. CBMA152]|uniref:helix-turn-helix domain-containing protein n=1 Tax=Streptomyces sp. CBMA152 TaxID=1896312 RepID=UPI001CB7079D|nr:helix-turn-helix transcriptional regulator [Streptomyces sp. CBMA152]MBD0745338.1 transcriptional regulator [Streptomyces sp. CBMA152]